MAAIILDLARVETRCEIVEHARQLREDFHPITTGDRTKLPLAGQQLGPLKAMRGRKSDSERRKRLLGRAWSVELRHLRDTGPPGIWLLVDLRHDFAGQINHRAPTVILQILPPRHHVFAFGVSDTLDGLADARVHPCDQLLAAR